MSKPTAAPKAWNELLDIVGGSAEFCEAIGISQSAWYRVCRGEIPFPAVQRAALEILCDQYETTHTAEQLIATLPRPRAKDLTQLRILGEAIERGFPVSAREIERLQAIYPEYQLNELAESDGTPPTIMRGVLPLLEGTVA